MPAVNPVMWQWLQRNVVRARAPPARGVGDAKAESKIRSRQSRTVLPAAARAHARKRVNRANQRRRMLHYDGER